MSDRIAPSEFDEAVAWAREEVNSEGHRALGIGFEIADASTGTSKMAYPDLTGREGTAFVKIAICPKGKGWPNEYAVRNATEFKDLVRFILANPSMFKTENGDALDGCVSLSDYQL